MVHLRKLYCVAALVGSVVAQPALADDRPQAGPTLWSGNLSLGFVQTRGNSDTSTLNGKAELGYAGKRWTNAFSAFLLRGSQDGQTTDERYSFADKIDFSLTPQDYAFGNAGYDHDRFGGVAERNTLTLGYGRHLLATPAHLLDLELGFGANRSRNRGENEFDYRSIYTVGGRYRWKISETSELSQTLRTEIASNDIYINPITQLKLTIIGQLFTVIAYEFRYNTKVPDGTRHLDQIATVNLGYSFGIKK